MGSEGRGQQSPSVIISHTRPPFGLLMDWTESMTVSPRLLLLLLLLLLPPSL